MKAIAKLLSHSPRLRNTLKTAWQCWRDGGVIPVTVTQINHGGILIGKRVLITGGSAGIGKAIAKKCLSEGAEVVITGRDPNKLENAKNELNSNLLYTLVWDVSDVSIASTKIKDIVMLLNGDIDILVNNAGILGGHRNFLDLDEDGWDKITSVNSKGLLFATQAVCRRWINNKYKGKIINMSSMRGVLGCVDGPYGMSKWGIIGLTQGLGLKMAKHGIQVNAIAPGIINTESIAIKGIDTKENAYLPYVPVSRIGLSEEIAEIAIFLMSDAANYIVGQTIVCDGGYSLKV